MGLKWGQERQQGLGVDVRCIAQVLRADLGRFPRFQLQLYGRGILWDPFVHGIPAFFLAVCEHDVGT